MLMQPTIEKLIAMKLAGMAEALRRQSEDPEMGRLSFEERIALLVDQQWTWRENKALTRRLKNARLKLMPPSKTSITGIPAGSTAHLSGVYRPVGGSPSIRTS